MREMTSAVVAPTQKLPSTPWGHLPPQIHTLFVTSVQRTGGWLADAFAADSASEVLLEECSGKVAGLARLRDDTFDSVLISHEPPELDALELLDAIRAGGGDDQPVIVLGSQSEQEMAAISFEAGADAYACVGTVTTRALIWMVARAIERRRLLAENRRLLQAETHRRELEQDESHRLLEQQRAIANDRSGSVNDRNSDHLPNQLVSHYRELLRTYVIMGSGNLATEMHLLTDLLVAARVTGHGAIQLHLQVLEEMIQGLGSRSARHVMNRADILVLEMMIGLSEGYRRQFFDRLHPPRQLKLPGFDDIRALEVGKTVAESLVRLQPNGSEVVRLI